MKNKNHKYFLIMVHLRGMVHEGWYMIQESKLWYDYIIMVRSGNAAAHFRNSKFVFYLGRKPSTCINFLTFFFVHKSVYFKPK